MQSFSGLPLHVIAAHREKCCIHTNPSKEYAKVEPEMMSTQTKEYRPASFDDLMQGPCISPVEEAWFNVDIVERRAHVRDHPIKLNQTLLNLISTI